MLCLKTHLSFPFRTPSLSSSSKHLTHHLRSSPFRSTIKMMSTKSKAIEHIVLFKVKENTEASKVTAMVTGLSSLISLDQVLHLTAGPILRNRSTALTFTHMLHSRYKSKEDLESYSAHPSHLSVVRGSVLPIVDDIMAVDWVAEDVEGADLVPAVGSAIRVTFMKLKEDAVSDEVVDVIRGIPESFKQIKELTCGKNFSPARAKGYSVASLAVFPGEKELEEVDSNKELVEYQKNKVRDRVESVVVIDYVVPQPPPQSASL
ncbi:unnamed protein product [Lathyrus sativus]|nr:unnamed protein product [Lathyrus sativus]